MKMQILLNTLGWVLCVLLLVCVRDSLPIPLSAAILVVTAIPIGLLRGYYECQCRYKHILLEIKEELHSYLEEPQYQHEDEDWQVGCIHAEEVIDKHFPGVKL